MNLYLKSQKFIICLSFQDIKIKEKLLNTDFYKKYIPDGELHEVVDSKYSEKDTINFEIIESDQVSFKFEYPKAKLLGSLNKNISIQTIIVLADYCLNYLRNSSGVYCINGSAISKEGKGVLLLGGVSGLGKTTLALNLCLHRNFKYVSDDKVILDEKGYLIGGTKVIHYNKSTLDKSISKNLDNHNLGTNEGLLKAEENNVPISLIIQPIIVRNGKLSFFEWSFDQTKFNLYEALTKKIRGISLRIGSNDLPVISIDTEELSLKRSEVINKLAKHIKAYTVIGDLDSVIKQTEELLQTAK